MDTFESALKIITPNCFMSSVDLKNAYYSIPVATELPVFLGKEIVSIYFFAPGII